MRILIAAMGHSPMDFENVDYRPRNGGEIKLIESIKVWSRNNKITIYCPEATKKIYGKIGLKVDYITLDKKYNNSFLGLSCIFLKRIIGSLSKKINGNDFDLILSSSDFLFDVIPSVLLKKGNPNLKLVSGIYLIAPGIFKNFKNYYTNKRSFPKFRNLLYYLNQRMSFYLLKKHADKVMVLNNFDKKSLIKKGFDSNKIFITSMGVNLNYIKKIKPSKTKYDGCFIGRLHPQKGIFDLIEIWGIIRNKYLDFRLSLIGGGSKHWFNRIKKEIKNKKLNNNINVLGFLKGEEIFSILKSSRVCLFPSTYESWGQVIVEAMACGVPVVSYNLPFFKHVFGDAIINVKMGYKKAFANKFLELVKDKGYYKKQRKKALLISKKYDWNLVANKELSLMRSVI